jgi:hypothetical protein
MGYYKNKQIEIDEKNRLAKRKARLAKTTGTGITTKKRPPRKTPPIVAKRKPTGTELSKRRPTGTELSKTKIPTTVKGKAIQKMAKKVGWAAARRAAASAIATASGPVGWAALGAYTVYELSKMAGKKPKPTPKPTLKKKPTVKKKPRGGSIGRTSMKDFKPKSKVETIKKKSTTSRYDPRKANRAGQRMGQRKAGGIIKKMKGGGRIKYI